jgi:hypothetical protein
VKIECAIDRDLDFGLVAHPDILAA